MVDGMTTTNPPRRGSALRAGRMRCPVPLLVILLATVILLAIVAVPTGTARAQGADPGPRFSWPLTPDPPVVRGFEAPADPFGPGHRGVDLGAADGQQVSAAAEGVVVFAGPLAGRGVVSIDHAGGLRTTYEPLTAAVVAGEPVARGAPIGTVTTGHPECAADTCLHWGVRRGEEYLDPLPLVRADTVLRLKPWSG